MKKKKTTMVPNPVLPSEVTAMLEEMKLPDARTGNAASALTTSAAFIGTPASPDVQKESTDKAKATQFLFTNEKAASGGTGPPESPNLLPVTDEFQPAVGVYVVPATTGGGKTVWSAAMTAWINSVPGLNATMYYVYEPRATPSYADGTIRFKNVPDFISDLTHCLHRASDPPKAIFIDSITYPMLAFASSPGFAHQATMEGGVQPSSRVFLIKLAEIAAEKQVTLFCTINSVRVPYASTLDDATEGLISLNDVMHFQLKDRTMYSGRSFKSFSIPIEYVNAALKHFGLGSYNRTTFRGGLRSVSGINPPAPEAVNS